MSISGTQLLQKQIFRAIIQARGKRVGRKARKTEAGANPARTRRRDRSAVISTPPQGGCSHCALRGKASTTEDRQSEYVPFAGSWNGRDARPGISHSDAAQNDK